MTQAHPLTEHDYEPLEEAARLAAEKGARATTELLTGDPANEYFSDGVTESLLTSLSKIDGLKVISRGSVFRFKGQEVDPREVGKQLNVAAVLEGSVRRDENSVRVAVRLVSAEDGRVLWASETYERTLRDIFALQDEIARQVTTGLRFKLSGENAQQLTRRYTDNVEAYQLYLKGRFFWNKRTQEGLRKGIEYFEQAIKLDPSYALAYAGLADSYNVMGSLGLIKPQEEYAKVEAAACKALEIDETLSEAHTALAWVRFQQWDWTGAEAEFKRAIELNPNYATAHQWYAEYLTAMARFDEALAEIGRAQQIDPTSLVINTIVAQTYLNARQYDEAIEQCHKTLELDPSFELAYIYLGNAYIEKGMYEEALAEYQKAKQLEGTPAMLALTGITYARSGNREGARRALHELMAVSKQKYDPSFNIARIYANLGDRDEAFKWLEKLFDERSGALIFLKVDPQLDKLRTDPRFTDLVRRVGLTP